MCSQAQLNEEALTDRLARLGATMREDSNKVLIAEAVEALHSRFVAPPGGEAMSIVELLEAHTLDCDWCPCSCGVQWVWDGRGSGPAQHRAHVAEVLDQHERERCYEAWREGVAVFDPDAVDIMEAINPYKS